MKLSWTSYLVRLPVLSTFMFSLSSMFTTILPSQQSLFCYPSYLISLLLSHGLAGGTKGGVDKCEWVHGTSMIPYLEVSGSQEGDPGLEWKNLSSLYRSSSLGTYLGLAHQLSWWTVGQKGSELVGEIGSWDGGGWFCFEARQSCSAQEAWVWDSCNCLIFLIELVACWQSIQMQKKILFKLGGGESILMLKNKKPKYTSALLLLVTHKGDDEW